MTLPTARTHQTETPLSPTRGTPSGRSIGRDLLRGNRALLALAAALSLASAAAALTGPWLAMDVTDALTQRESVIRPAVGMSVAVLGAAALQALCGWLLAGVGERTVLRLRRRAMDHLLRLPLRTVRDEGAGSLTARVTSDAVLLRLLIESGLVHLPVALIATVATLAAMAVIDPVLTLVAVGSFGLAGVCVALMTARMKHLASAQQRALGHLAQGLTSHLTALVIVKACRYEAAAGQRLGRAAADVRAACLPASRLQCLIGPVVSLGQQVAVLAVALAAGQRITRGELSLASFSGFFLYLLHLSSPVAVAAVGIGHLQTGLAARSRFHHLFALAAERDYSAPPATRPPPRREVAAVVFEHVSFTHPGGSPVLDRVSFHAPATGLTALVGSSGAGKSTVLTLINRLTEPDLGEIRVLGRPADNWPLSELRRRATYVDQHSTLVEGTVRENLRIGLTRPVDDEELVNVLETVGLREAVLSLPRALDTPLGRSLDLSGGQRQRLAVARALLTESEIVLLDEPNSQLDGVSEHRVSLAIDHLAATRCVIAASHRLSIVRNARHIILFEEDGTVVAGDHEALLTTSSHYRALVAGANARARYRF
ncbi:ABC transporter ATP-binding protein [Streptomyces sp. NPDC006368]|uniref:ABC transporter ATP-binding protein n=1 Tax=Streptomyces sp. NPDC006368 TaxID=3156760 RepID=UPI0033B63F12